MNHFRDLTYEDLYTWVGQKTVSKGRSYQKNKRVIKVFQISDTIICGSVQGTGMYDTVVSVSDHFFSTCSCPVGIDCKHGVALILTYLELTKKGIAVPEPPLEEYVRKYQPLLESETKLYDPGISSFEGRIPITEEYLQKLSKNELIKIILSGIEGTHDIATYLDRRQKMDQASPDSLISAIIAEIDDVTSQEYRYSDWYDSDDENRPDYSGIFESFTVLLEAKRYQDIVTLGLTLLQKTNEQIEMYDDNCSISSQITECMAVVAEALELSDLPVHENLRSAINLIQNDEYSLTEDILDFVNEPHPVLEWSKVADIILEERSTFPTGAIEYQSQNSFSTSDWIEISLERGGRVDEAIAFSKRLAEEENRNLPFITLLARTNHKKEAIEWIQIVVRQTSHDPHAVFPFLQEMRRLYEESADWLMITALDTEAFLRNPDFKTYKQMMESAKKAGIVHSLRPYIHAYLREGTIPSSQKSGSIIPGLLPDTGVSFGKRIASVKPPVRSLLLEMALETKDPDEVLLWYIPNNQKTAIDSDPVQDDRVAGVIAERNPDMAVEIWKNLAENLIDLKNADSYRYAVTFLSKIRDISLKTGKSKEFIEYIFHLKKKHAKKRRFIQELAVLEDSISNFL